MSMEKAIKHLPISNNTDENNPPDPIPCHSCGKDRGMLFLDIPMVGTRWVHSACKCQIDELENFKKEQESRERNRHIRKILNLSSSMEELKTYSWDNLTARDGSETSIEEVKKAVAEFDERGKLGLHIFGETGNGKTHITASGANDLLNRGYSVIFLTEKDLLSRFRESDHFNNKERFFEIMDACMQADLLVWDDLLSSQRLEKKEKDYIFQVVNGRERANKPIWFTSNLSPEEFQKSKYALHLDDKGRTWGRIIGNTVAVYNRATNYRKEEATRRMRGN